MLERKYFHDLFGGEAGPGSVAPRVLLINDPLSVPMLAQNLVDVTSVADHYECRLMTGFWHRVPISICSTGIGGGSASIAVDNLVRLGAQTLVYADAGLVESHSLGFWSAIGAVRQDGASLDYARPDFPAVADVSTQLALQAAAQSLQIRVQPALFWASAGPLDSEKQTFLQSYWDRQASSASPYFTQLVVTPPEPATILTLATLYQVRAGAVFAGLEDRSQQENVLAQVFALALSALHFLEVWDVSKNQNGWKLMTPPFRTTNEANYE